ncbi:hypothetical protein [Acholeplasma granularum]|uniref:hypothetical protein n=1 Tax=Acholeplasma granularum TaxID=264635 RepID=UPI00047141EC|nr:hypothetical protein [Acholeplasma granularum]
MKKVFSLVSILILGVVLVACGPKADIIGPDEVVAIKTSFADQNTQRRFTYEQSNPLVMPDGKTITTGELKPTWQFVESQLNLDITDVSTPGQRPVDMFDFAAANSFADANVYGGGNLGERIMDAGVEGYFVPLNDHWDRLPNFKKYLDANPLVSESITAWDGNIYHAPYIAEIDNYARMYMGRYSWVTALLDGEVDGNAFAHETETAELTIAYEPYWVSGSITGLPYGNLRKTKNVAQLQADAAVAGKINGVTALQVLKNYIDEVYPTLEKRSDLFLGETGQYDIDELTALWRVIKLHPNTLTKEATGTVRAEATIYPFFTRQSNHREELLRLQVYFGGQRVHGSDSYGSRFYIDHNGELQYSYAQDSFLNNLQRIRGWAREGLVDQRIFGQANSTNLRTGLIFSDGNEANKVFGFMTYDFTSSTTAATGGQDDVIAILPPLTTTPASNGEFVHYVENARVVKPDGWGISSASTEKEIAASLKMFDYFFTEEGAKVQNYGTPDMWVEGEEFENPFDGTKGPKFNDWTITTAGAVSNGDISSFLRDHVGSLIAIGYQKEIGFELQATSENGFKSWDLYFGNETRPAVIMNSYTATEPYYQLAPAIISLNLNEVNIVTNQTTMRADTQLVDNIFGFIGDVDGEDVPKDVAGLKAMFTTANVATYVEIYRTAYARISG